MSKRTQPQHALDILLQQLPPDVSLRIETKPRWNKAKTKRLTPSTWLVIDGKRNYIPAAQAEHMSNLIADYRAFRRGDRILHKMEKEEKKETNKMEALAYGMAGYRMIGWRLSRNRMTFFTPEVAAIRFSCLEGYWQRFFKTSDQMLACELEARRRVKQAARSGESLDFFTALNRVIAELAQKNAEEAAPKEQTEQDSDGMLVL